MIIRLKLPDSKYIVSPIKVISSFFTSPSNFYFTII
jgi:hypothetical protein